MLLERDLVAVFSSDRLLSAHPPFGIQNQAIPATQRSKRIKNAGKIPLRFIWHADTSELVMM